MSSRHDSMPRLLIPLSCFVAVIVVVEAALSPVGFGASGSSLLLLMSAILYPLAAGVFLATPLDSTRRLVAVAGMAASAIGLHVADPNGPVIGLFLIAALAPLTTQVFTSTVILVVAVLGYNAVQLGLGSEAVIITIATDAGCAFFYLFGALLRTERAQREAVSRLLQELEASRHAEREASRLAERATLAREVHDVLAHSMSGLVLQLSGAQLLAQTTDTDPRLLDALHKSRQLARSGLDEARQAVQMLRGEALLGLEAVSRLLDNHAEATGIDVDWRETGDRQVLPAQVDLTVYRWAQEVLSNVRKHAPQQVAHLQLTWSADDLTLSAWNELGTAVSRDRPSSGFGLRGMAERAHELGGTVDVEHSARCFRTTMRLPLMTAGSDGTEPSPRTHW